MVGTSIRIAHIGIIGVGSYVPPHEMSKDDWAEIVDTSDEWITTKTGMKKRRIADSDVCTSDLAVEALSLIHISEPTRPY